MRANYFDLFLNLNLEDPGKDSLILNHHLVEDQTGGEWSLFYNLPIVIIRRCFCI